MAGFRRKSRLHPVLCGAIALPLVAHHCCTAWTSVAIPAVRRNIIVAKEALRGKFALGAGFWEHSQAQAAVHRTVRRSSKTSPQSWAASWVEKEVSQSPVVLFTDASSPESKAARAGLSEAQVRFQQVDVSELGQLGGDGSSWASLVSEYLVSRSSATSLPVLFIGGKSVGGLAAMGKLAAAGKLTRLCVDAGAARVEAEIPFTNLSWTPREGMRMLPPKDLGGRRWYQDLPGMSKSPDDHKDPARWEYSMNTIVTRSNGNQVTSSCLNLLRDDTNLDEPDKYGLKLKPYGVQNPPRDLGTIETVLNCDWAPLLGDRYREVERSNSIGPEEAKREGLRIPQLKWLYSLTPKEIVAELKSRQCKHQVDTAIDVQSLRQVLKEEMLKERDWSPTEHGGVAPGVVQKLTGAEFQRERHADTKVPLLVALTNWNPGSFNIRDELHIAAKRLLRATRIVRVDPYRYPEVARNLSAWRFPTLIWLQAGTGTELSRTVGVVSAMEIFERSRAVLHCRELPEARRSEALAVLEDRQQPVSRSRWLRNGGMMREAVNPPKWAITRSLRGWKASSR